MKEMLNALTALDAVGDGVVCTDHGLEINFINKKACEILGRESRDVLGFSLGEIMSIQTDHGPFVESLANEVIAVGKPRGLKQNSYIVMDGKKLYVSASISRLNGCDDCGVVINFRDITRLKQYEFDYLREKSKFESLFKTMPMGVIVIDNSRMVKYYNPFIERQFRTENDEGVARLIGDILRCKNAKEQLCGTSNQCTNCILKRNVEQINTGDIFHRTMKIKFYHDFEGIEAVRYYQVEFSTIEDGQASSIMILIQDITKQMAYEKELKAARKEALEANKLKSQFLANMSHEIRTPLNGIIGMIDLTKRMVKDEELIDNLTTAKTSSEGLLRIINDVLDYSKLEAGKMSFRAEEFELNGMIQEVISENRFEATLKGLTINLIWDSRINGRVIGDKLRLKQVFNNLMTNSIKFTDEGGIMLKISRVSSEEEPLVLDMRVVDTGIGIDESQRSMLFNSFTQADGSYTRKSGGTGLGLAISKEIVERMNGTITFYSTVGQGTEFVVKMPFEQGQNWELEEGIQKKMADKRVVSGNVLLVEDDLINQMVIRKKLEIDGYIVEIANDGQEGVDLFQENVYDLVIMDIQMPVMSGTQAVDIMRGMKRGNSTPIIALTALALKQDKENIMSHGFDYYVTKPIDLERLSRITLQYVNMKASYHFDKAIEQTINETEMESYTEDEVITLVNEIQVCIKEKQSDQLEAHCIRMKEYFESCHMVEYRMLAFKMSMAARKAHYDKVEGYLKEIQLQLEL